MALGMGILDKIRPQPRWKHPDPEVRLEGVRELDDVVEIAVIAETDPEARVRLAAIARLDDPVVLGRVLAGDPDDDARERAADRLHALATNGSTAEVALAAVQGLSDPRRLSAIARGDYADEVRTEALSRTTDERALGAIARNARHASTARAALDRLNDSAEVLSVALESDHADVALAAVERVVAESADLEQLRTIQTRSRQKDAVRRARDIAEEIEKAEAARRAAEEARRRREAALCDEVAGLADASDPARARAELERLTGAWDALDVADAAARSRFEAGTEAAQRTIARLEREAEEAAELARSQAEAMATRVALCERVETLDGDDVLEQLQPIDEEWRSLTPLVGDGPEADRVAERFALAVAACRKRHEMGAALADARERLAALVAEAETLLSLEDAAAASARWQVLSREARGLTATLSDASRPEPELEERLTAVGQGFTTREAEARQALANAQQQAVSILQRLADRARRVADAETVTLREGERLMRDIVAGLDQAGRVESNREIDDAVRTLRTLQEQVAPRVHELREMDDWRRFANGQQQEKLIAMAEAIVASLRSDEEAGKEPDLAATAKALRELHAKWHEVAEGPRHSAQRLWDRFRTSTDEIRGRCGPYFAQLRENRTQNLEQKLALVEEAESLAQSSDWGKTAARFQELQDAWKTTGPVNREQGRELAHRFRTACNAFFARRREDLADRKKVWSENLARKEALCDRAEALAESSEWDAASAELKRLQAEWKTIGPVRRNKSEAVWKRFRAAADRFFERYHHRHELALASKLAERDAIVEQLEALAGTDGEAAPDDLTARLHELRAQWNRSMPLPPAEMKPLDERWQAAFARIGERWASALAGTEFDPDTIGGKLEKLVARIEEYLDTPSSTAGALSPTELLAERLRTALASNAMGGRANEAAKWRAAAEAVRDAQTSWQRLAPLAAARAQELETRFRKACRRVSDEARRHAGPTGRRPSARPARRPREVAAR